MNMQTKVVRFHSASKSEHIKLLLETQQTIQTQIFTIFCYPLQNFKDKIRLWVNDAHLGCVQNEQLRFYQNFDV